MSDLNDPRVFFAAERTLLAWNRTCLTLMAFGFVVERFGLFLHMLAPQMPQHLERGISFWVGLGFILLGSLMAVLAVIQYRRVLRTLKPVEIPDGYWVNMAALSTLLLAVLGMVLSAYLTMGLK
ncbi:YidH family protein [Sulfuriferula sp. GW1]|uniref:YidH family protein n=1 Tax=Sulfuriferula sp. GW1 TaxID=3345111 RepID=UPI0039AEDD6A